MNNVTNRIQSLARTHCATFDTATADRCLLDCQCVYFRQSNGRCRYFEQSVLPVNAELERTYKAERGLIDGSKYAACMSCKKPFLRTGGRQLYCSPCGTEQARAARNKRAREYRKRNK